MDFFRSEKLNEGHCLGQMKMPGGELFKSDKMMVGELSWSKTDGNGFIRG